METRLNVQATPKKQLSLFQYVLVLLLISALVIAGIFALEAYSESKRKAEYRASEAGASSDSDQDAAASSSTSARPTSGATKTTAYELTTDDKLQIIALDTSWKKLSTSQQNNICTQFDNDIDAAVDPMTASGNFDEETVVAYLTVACA